MDYTVLHLCVKKVFTKMLACKYLSHLKNECCEKKKEKKGEKKYKEKFDCAWLGRFSSNERTLDMVAAYT